MVTFVESSAYVLLRSHRVNFPSPVILSRHRVTHVPDAQHMWKCSNSQAKSIVLYGVYQLLGLLLNTFLILPFKVDLNTVYFPPSLPHSLPFSLTTHTTLQ